MSVTLTFLRKVGIYVWVYAVPEHRLTSSISIWLQFSSNNLFKGRKISSPDVHPTCIKHGCQVAASSVHIIPIPLISSTLQFGFPSFVTSSVTNSLLSDHCLLQPFAITSRLLLSTALVIQTYSVHYEIAALSTHILPLASSPVLASHYQRLLNVIRTYDVEVSLLFTSLVRVKQFRLNFYYRKDFISWWRECSKLYYGICFVATIVILHCSAMFH